MERRTFFHKFSFWCKWINVVSHFKRTKNQTLHGANYYKSDIVGNGFSRNAWHANGFFFSFCCLHCWCVRFDQSLDHQWVKAASEQNKLQKERTKQTTHKAFNIFFEVQTLASRDLYVCARAPCYCKMHHPFSGERLCTLCSFCSHIEFPIATYDVRSFLYFVLWDFFCDILSVTALFKAFKLTPAANTLCVHLDAWNRSKRWCKKNLKVVKGTAHIAEEMNHDGFQCIQLAVIVWKMMLTMQVN